MYARFNHEAGCICVNQKMSTIDTAMCHPSRLLRPYLDDTSECQPDVQASRFVARRLSQTIRWMASLLSLFIIIVFFLSTAFVVLHDDHEHDHHGPNNNCSTCIHIASMEDVLRQLSTTLLGTTAVAIAFFIASHRLFQMLPATVESIIGSSLVSWKIRMNQ